MAKGGSLSLNTKRGKVREALRNPIEVLKSIESKACNKEYQYERLYRNLYNPEFYLLAYGNIYAKEGNMTPGADGNTIDGMGLEKIDKIIDSMKNHSYKPKPARRIYIEKKGNTNKKRPLGIPSFEDKLIQEVVRMILQSIYEPNFSKLSHGFRPKKSCHTALLHVQANFTGVKWFIEGDIKSFFDTIDHHILVNILRRRIKDEYFIALIWKFLKAGYIENWKFNNTYSGTPQGSISSPILSNIYLNELDVFMEEYIQDFNNGKRRKRNPEYSKYDNQLQSLKRNKYTPKQWELLTDEEKSVGLEKIKCIRKEMLTKEYSNPQDNGYKRLFYVRYADDWLCGVIGSKTETEYIKADIKEFLDKKLKLELSESKTLITNAQNKARFLGFDVLVSNNNSATKTSKGVTQRTRLRKIILYVPREKWQNKLIEYKALKLNYNKEQGYNEVFEPVHRSYLINNEDLEIVKQYNSEIRGMYNYYRIADNVSVLNSFYYVMICP